MVTPETRRLPVSGNESIAVDWIAPRGARPVAWFVHGFGSHRRGEKALFFAEQFAALGWGFLAADLRGHGESDGSLRGLTMTRGLEDLQAVLDGLPAKDAPLLLIGSSMGGALGAWLALLRPGAAKGMAMIAPSLRFPAGLAAGLPEAEREDWRRSGVRRVQNEWLDVEVGYGLVEDAARYDPARLEREHALPSLILHGMADTSVDWRQSLAFTERCSCPDISLTLIKGGDHRLTAHKRFLFETTLSWWSQRFG